MSAVTKLVLPYPPSGNRSVRLAGGRIIPNPKALAYKRQVAGICEQGGVRPLLGPVILSGTVYRPRAVGDLNNVLKVLQDALNGYAWLDDSQVVKFADFEWAPFTDPKRPRVELTLTGERFGLLSEAHRHREAAAVTAQKRRATLKRNRAARPLGAKPAVYR